MRRELVETSVLVPSQRGQPLWVGYAWNVRALGLGQYACSLCRTVGLGRRQICVQRCNQVRDFFLKDCVRWKPLVSFFGQVCTPGC